MPGWLLQTGSNPGDDKRGKSVLMFGSLQHDWMHEQLHSTTPHLGFRPSLRAVDEDETSFSKAGPILWAGVPAYKKHILNILLICKSSTISHLITVLPT